MIGTCLLTSSKRSKLLRSSESSSLIITEVTGPCDDHIHAALAGEREGAVLKDLVRSTLY